MNLDSVIYLILRKEIVIVVIKIGDTWLAEIAVHKMFSQSAILFVLPAVFLYYQGPVTKY